MHRSLLFLMLLCCSITSHALGSSKFVVLICSYNNALFVEQNILSVVNQDYDNFRVIYVDDGSTDDTYPILQETLQKTHKSHLVKIIRNDVNKGTPLANHYHVIHHEIADDEIVVLLDGDDQLAGPFVLTYLNNIYDRSNKTIWMTYGQFQEIQSGTIGWCVQYPKEVVKHNTFRDYVHMPSHLKTFYAWLFKKIDLQDLLYEGQFYPMSGDLAIMLPMIEMARSHHFFINKVLYLYNEGNPISDHRKSFEKQMDLARHIRSLKRYAPLD